MEIFERLDDNDLKELIPTLGDRKKFKLQLEKYKVGFVESCIISST